MRKGEKVSFIPRHGGTVRTGKVVNTMRDSGDGIIGLVYSEHRTRHGEWSYDYYMVRKEDVL